MKRLYRSDVLASMKDRLLEDADQTSPVGFDLDVAGRCERPVGVELEARLDDRQAAKRGADLPIFIRLATPCRKCDRCLHARKVLWARRAMNEIRAWERTWFGTLTLGPEQQFLFLAHARKVANRRGHDYDHATAAEQFRWRVAAITPHITRYLKRVRKQSGGRVRYLLVAEPHKSGAPHFHILVHDCDPLNPVRKAVLKDQWKLGFTKWKLCDTEAAWYVAKYLAKDINARVRASVRYGEASSDIGRSFETRPAVASPNSTKTAPVIGPVQ